MCFIENGFCLILLDGGFLSLLLHFQCVNHNFCIYTCTLTELEQLVSTTDMELDSISVNKLASLFPEVDPASTTELVLTILELEQDNQETYLGQ